MTDNGRWAASAGPALRLVAEKCLAALAHTRSANFPQTSSALNASAVVEPEAIAVTA